jgi:nucleoside-diphosphate-sugar epimerase
MTSKTINVEMDPRQYIEKVRVDDGKVIPEAFSPEQLLVSAHRDFHPGDVYARVAMSQLVDLTADEAWVKSLMKRVRKVGHKSTNSVSQVIPFSDAEKISMAMFGLKNRNYTFRFKDLDINHETRQARLTALQNAGQNKLDKLSPENGMRILLTGGTGFVGQELITQLSGDTRVEEVVVLIRPKVIRDRKTGEIIQTVSPQERGDKLLRQLGIIQPNARTQFRFVTGDIEKPCFGINQNELIYLKHTTTHVIHCAASVSFDASYEDSFKANVQGSRNALEFSLMLQETKGSPFVSHLSIETSYIHGRQQNKLAKEDELIFPKNFYNNHYELTKAMASQETERFMFESGLRVIQLCPSIVIGQTRTGNNYGDMKVVNAPVNAFGRAHYALTNKAQSMEERVTGWFIAQLACIFPGDPRAKLNLIPVERVAAGIVAALDKPDAIGARVHLATNNFVTSKTMRDICAEEIGVNVRLAEPTLHRNLTLPLMTRLLSLCNQGKLANALEKLGTIFGGYSEWGQPIHEVGNDVTLLGLDSKRPDTADALRMLCRHNQYVQEFGLIRDADEVARRERVWAQVIDRVEQDHQLPAAKLPPEVFSDALNRHLDLEHFVLLRMETFNNRAA